MPAPQAALDAYRLGRLDQAEAILRRAVAKDPRDADALNVLGVVLSQLGKAEQARFALERSLAVRPDNPATLANLGNALLLAGESAAARGAFERALALSPDLETAWLGLGPALHNLGDVEGSIKAARRAVELSPGDASALQNLASALTAAGGEEQVRAATAALGRALSMAPGKASLLANYLLGLHYDPAVTPAEIFAEHVARAKRFVAANGVVPTLAGAFANPREPERLLRVGYLSADLRGHVVARFMEGVLRGHDRAAFHVTAYQNGLVDAESRRLAGLCDQWREVLAMSDAALKAMIARDRIDVLVDLSGHTDGSRPGLLAQRAAPVQVTYLGYPNTTGLAGVDVRVTDAVADPAAMGSAADLATERLVRLSRCFLAYTPPADIPAVAGLPLLRAGHVTFGCFNGAPKINAPLIELFARVLLAVPGSRLILKNRALSSPERQAWVRGVLDRAGVGAERVDLLAWEPSGAHHLAAYHRVDVALDSFPYGGTTTTCEALWMGVPVVTMAGANAVEAADAAAVVGGHASRVGASILSAAGLAELVTRTPEAFVACAAGLAGDVPRLSALRETMRDRLSASPVGDAVSLTRALEGVYREAWRRHCAGT
jgi:predicted O-linked N-acetylglucosamine transferase (SPINDLY family)